MSDDKTLLERAENIVMNLLVSGQAPESVEQVEAFAHFMISRESLTVPTHILEDLGVEERFSTLEGTFNRANHALIQQLGTKMDPALAARLVSHNASHRIMPHGLQVVGAFE